MQQTNKQKSKKYNTIIIYYIQNNRITTTLSIRTSFLCLRLLSYPLGFVEFKD